MTTKRNSFDRVQSSPFINIIFNMYIYNSFLKLHFTATCLLLFPCIVIVGNREILAIVIVFLASSFVLLIFNFVEGRNTHIQSLQLCVRSSCRFAYH